MSVTEKMLPSVEGQFSNEQVELIKRTICKDATTDELQLFVQQCTRTKLDPFTKQIYFIKDKNGKVNVMASIDGLRLIADRSGKYAGQTKPEWCDTDGKWTDIWLKDKPPVAARVGVHKIGFVEPLYATAMYKAYAPASPSPYSTWGKMPEHMLAKVAESLALRKAFPNEMSGVYGEEEFGQGDKQVAVSTNPKDTNQRMTTSIQSKVTQLDGTNDIVDIEFPVTNQEIAVLFTAAMQNGHSEEAIDTFLKQQFNITENDFGKDKECPLSRAQYKEAIEKFGRKA